MRMGFKLKFMALMTIGVMLAHSLTVQAPTIDIGSNTMDRRTYELREGDTITWEWEVVSEGYIDFWIEDSLGTKYQEVSTEISGSGSFEVPEDGEWSVVFYNPGMNPIILDYKITIEDYSPAILMMLVLIIIIIVVILILLLTMKKKQLQPPDNTN